MKIYVGIPEYSGKLDFEIIRCLLIEQAIAMSAGDEITFNLLSGNAGIVQARNQLATEFLESGFDRLVFLDGDISFEPGAIVKLARQPVDLVGGGYRYKQTNENYPIRWLDKEELWANEHGLLEVEMIPTGFMAISRSLFEKLLEKYPERSKTKQCGVLAYCFFQMPFIDGHLYGEDFQFCKDWREIGGKVFLDPEINLTHWGFKPTPHKGHIGNWLKNRPMEAVDGHST